MTIRTKHPGSLLVPVPIVWIVIIKTEGVAGGVPANQIASGKLRSAVVVEFKGEFSNEEKDEILEGIWNRTGVCLVAEAIKGGLTVHYDAYSILDIGDVLPRNNIVRRGLIRKSREH